MIKAGLDIGNGYSKCQLVSETGQFSVDIPSCTAPITRTHDIKEPEAEVMADIFNKMDLSFDSVLVHDSNRRLFGAAALHSGVALEEFDVYSNVSKAQTDLSGVLILGILAGKALSDFYISNKKLPDTLLKTDAYIALALPVTEFKKHRALYAEKLKKSSHIVTFHNFDTPVRVEIFVKGVQVLAEGQAAQYAITRNGEAFVESMLEDARSHGVALTGITAKDIIGAKSTLSLDIGEGTVNMPVFMNGKFDANVSDSFNKGYGQVLTQALDRLTDKGYRYESRKKLADFLNAEPSAMKKAQYDMTKRIVDEEAIQFTDELVRQFEKVLSKVEAYVEVIYVYGGGATPLKEFLFDRLLSVVRVGDVDRFPVLYLDSVYSRFLNMSGLYILADAVYNFSTGHTS